MNILLFVSSLLMILALMTYARVDSFRYFLGMDARFEHYMSTVERLDTNEAAENWYKTSKAKKGRGGGGKSFNAAPRISFKIFVDQKVKQKNPQAYAQTVQWTKNLMTTLYGKQNFFIEATQKNPFFMDQLIEAIENAAQTLPQTQPLKAAIDLSNLDVGPDLKQTFYLMLKGCLREDHAIKKSPEKPERQFNVTLPETNEDSDEEDEVADEALEYSGAKGYDSLLNYITLRNTTKIRLYLASKPVLQAIFGNASTVDQFIQTRNDLYQSVKSDSMQADVATKELQAAVQSHIGNIDDAFFDFRVTKTNPADYN